MAKLQIVPLFVALFQLPESSVSDTDTHIFLGRGSGSTGKERSLIKGNFVRQSAKGGRLEGNSGPQGQ